MVSTFKYIRDREVRTSNRSINPTLVGGWTMASLLSVYEEASECVFLGFSSCGQFLYSYSYTSDLEFHLQVFKWNGDYGNSYILEEPSGSYDKLNCDIEEEATPQSQYSYSGKRQSAKPSSSEPDFIDVRKYGMSDYRMENIKSTLSGITENTSINLTQSLYPEVKERNHLNFPEINKIYGSTTQPKRVNEVLSVLNAGLGDSESKVDSVPKLFRYNGSCKHTVPNINPVSSHTDTRHQIRCIRWRPPIALFATCKLFSDHKFQSSSGRDEHIDGADISVTLWECPDSGALVVCGYLPVSRARSSLSSNRMNIGATAGSSTSTKQLYYYSLVPPLNPFRKHVPIRTFSTPTASFPTSIRNDMEKHRLFRTLRPQDLADVDSSLFISLSDSSESEDDSVGHYRAGGAASRTYPSRGNLVKKEKNKESRGKPESVANLYGLQHRVPTVNVLHAELSVARPFPKPSVLGVSCVKRVSDRKDSRWNVYNEHILCLNSGSTIKTLRWLSSPGFDSALTSAFDKKGPFSEESEKLLSSFSDLLVNKCISTVDSYFCNACLSKYAPNTATSLIQSDMTTAGSLRSTDRTQSLFKDICFHNDDPLMRQSISTASEPSFCVNCHARVGVSVDDDLMINKLSNYGNYTTEVVLPLALNQLDFAALLQPLFTHGSKFSDYDGRVVAVLKYEEAYHISRSYLADSALKSTSNGISEEEIASFFGIHQESRELTSSSNLTKRFTTENERLDIFVLLHCIYEVTSALSTTRRAKRPHNDLNELETDHTNDEFSSKTIKAEIQSKVRETVKSHLFSDSKSSEALEMPFASEIHTKYQEMDSVTPVGVGKKAYGKVSKSMKKTNISSSVSWENIITESLPSLHEKSESVCPDIPSGSDSLGLNVSFSSASSTVSRNSSEDVLNDSSSSDLSVLPLEAQTPASPAIAIGSCSLNVKKNDPFDFDAVDENSDVKKPFDIKGDSMTKSSIFGKKSLETSKEEVNHSDAKYSVVNRSQLTLLFEPSSGKTLILSHSPLEANLQPAFDYISGGSFTDAPVRGLSLVTSSSVQSLREKVLWKRNPSDVPLSLSNDALLRGQSLSRLQNRMFPVFITV